MRKKIAGLMIITLLFRLFCLSAVAAESDKTTSKDFSVEQKDTVHRYAVDVEYESMSIPVSSAIWDVNNYYYQVLMGGGIIGNDDYFDFDITMINHSDMPIDVQITVKADEMDIEKITKLTDGVLTTADKHEIPKVSEEEKKAQTSVTNIALKPKVGWESFINTLIANGATNGSSYTVGNVSIVITKN